MTLKLPLQNGKKHISIVSCYAPTMTNPDDVIAKFYEELNSTLLDIPKTEKLLILCDFNARVGSDHHIWKGVLGKFGIGQCNSNGLLLLQTCAEHKLLISNTIFSLPMRKRT
ncbi:craniofacial development protein 2 [Biomphalaria glabrata]|nr:craniofacial development protein 2 [Biomphalaria glabrata]